MAEKAAKKTTGKPSPARDQAAPQAEGSSMIRDVQQFVQLMVDNDLNELEIRQGDCRIHPKRGGQDLGVAAAPAMVVQPATGAVPEDRYTPAQQVEDEAAAALIEITSPMVGTFYTAASPDTDPFVAAGDVVGADDVVCIIEAMKVMNEIRAECAGVVAEVCVKNAQPVEFGQTLFKVKPG